MSITKIQSSKQVLDEEYELISSATDKQLSEYNKKLSALQQKCSHASADATKEAGADTGNWCSQDDSYWYHIDCPDCGYTKRYLNQIKWNNYINYLRRSNYKITIKTLKALKEKLLN